MTVSIQLPAELERDLRREFANLDQAAKEAMLVELYRQKKLSHHQLSEALGLDRFQTEDLLHKHQVTEDLGVVEEYLADARTLEQLRKTDR